MAKLLKMILFAGSFVVLTTEFALAQSAIQSIPPLGAAMVPAPVVKAPVLPPNAPDPKTNPMLAQYIQDGIQLYYLGNRSGLDGWFLLKNGQVQVVYATADNQSLVLGVLYGTDGQAITENQVSALNQAHPEVAAEIQKFIQQSGQVYMQTPPAGAMANANFAAPQSPGEKLVQELQTTAGVDLGNPKAPMLYMVMDPNCPHCQATWHALRDAVFKNTLQIHLVPIGKNDEDERAAAQLLKSRDPLNAWDKYVGGDKTQLAGDPDPLALVGVKTNHTFVDRWSIKETPYIVYRAKDGKIKILAGEPQKLEALLGDVGP